MSSVRHGGSVIRPAAEAGGGAEDGELHPEAGAAGQLQPPDQVGDGGLQHEGELGGLCTVRVSWKVLGNEITSWRSCEITVSQPLIFNGRPQSGLFPEYSCSR